MGTSARSRYEAFHGRKVRQEKQVRFNFLESQDELVYLGRAVAIEYESDKINGTPAGGEGQKAVYRHEFGRGDILCTDKTGTQLFILGPKLRTTTRGIID